MSFVQINRRGLIGMVGAAALAAPLRSIAGEPGGAELRITLLGTAGGPPPHLGRSQPATLIEVGGKSYLIDAGENVAQQLVRAGVPSPKLSAVLLTHLHWDHTLGLDYLMATGWMMGRRTALPIWGPPGTREFVNRAVRQVELGEAIFRAQATDRPKLSRLYPAHETVQTVPHVLLDDGTVRISAVENSHFAMIRAPRHAYGVDRALSYRFDTPQGSVVFTGDTGPSDALAHFARGAAVLVSEITDLPSMRAALQQTGSRGPELETLMQHMEHQHLTPAELGRLATTAGVRKLVLTHYVIGRSFNPDDFVPQIRPHFAGEIVVGKDMTRISLPG